MAARDLIRLLVAACAVLASPGVAAQTGQYVPQGGQPGKDVIWEPTPAAAVERMLRMARTTDRDYVVDLGAGDGRIVIAAAKNYGARATGVEYDARLAALARSRILEAGLSSRAEVVQGDLFEFDFSGATVLTMFLLPELNLRLREESPASRIRDRANAASRGIRPRVAAPSFFAAPAMTMRPSPAPRSTTRSPPRSCGPCAACARRRRGRLPDDILARAGRPTGPGLSAPRRRATPAPRTPRRGAVSDRAQPFRDPVYSLESRMPTLWNGAVLAEAFACVEGDVSPRPGR